MKRNLVVTVLVVFALGVLVIGLLGGIFFLTSASHPNPPVVAEPKWDTTQTRALAKRACFDCHSNETAWPWYTSVPLVAQVIQRDVVEGRRELNFSDWSSRFTRKAREATEKINSGEMPPANYIMMHPEAKLTAAEKQQLINGLLQSLK